MKQRKVGNDSMVEEACVRWIREKRNQDFNISQGLLIERARMFAEEFGHNDWEPSRGWAYRFCKRYVVRSKRLFGEAAAADTDGKMRWLEEEWPEMTKRYTPECIYNAGEHFN